MRRPHIYRKGFSLVELLAAIAIVSLLSAIAFGLFKAASDSRNKAKTLAGLQTISLSCESYRRVYGDFPVCETGSDANFRTDLFNQLVGKRRLYIDSTRVGEAPRLLDFNNPLLTSGGTTQRVQRSFINDDVVSTNNGSIANGTQFIDAWGNPYDYRYRILTSYANYKTRWKSPNFLLVSCGVEYTEPTTAGEAPPFNDYWASSIMSNEGIVPATYFDEPIRADNIVNWQQ